MSATYDIVQSVFMMNQSANAIAGFCYTNSQLQQMLSVYLSGGSDIYGKPWTGFFETCNPKMAGSDWKVTWGPAVYSGTSTSAGYSENTMYVAYSESLQTYVVAVGATNFDSIYDWLAEDGDVAYSHQAPWPLTLPFVRPDDSPKDPTTPVISAATAQGVSNLLCDLTDPVTSDGIETYLQGVASTSVTLIVTGHSLGGALSPTLALYLKQAMPNAWSAVRFLATAGATPGNQQFADLFASNGLGPVDTGISERPYGTKSM